MKKLSQLIILSLLLYSCENNSTDPDSTVPELTNEELQQQIIDNHQLDSQLVGTWDFLSEQNTDSIYYKLSLFSDNEIDTTYGQGVHWSRYHDYSNGQSILTWKQSYFTYNNLIVVKSFSSTDYYHSFTRSYLIRNDTLILSKNQDFQDTEYEFFDNFPYLEDSLFFGNRQTN